MNDDEATGGSGAPQQNVRAKAHSSLPERVNDCGSGNRSRLALRDALAPSDTSTQSGIDIMDDVVVRRVTKTALPVVQGLRPRQVLAATLLVQGQLGIEVAAAIGIAPETLCRWKQQPEFQALVHELLRDSIDATKLGLVTLLAEGVVHLRGLVRSFDDKIALRAVALLLTKIGPVLTAIGSEVGRPLAHR